jgi:hypothetical protein
MVTGTGISTDPYMLYNLADLELIGTTGYPLSAYYELVNDIDASATSNPTYNSGQGFIPIGGGGGPTANRFNGDFNGNGYTVSGLYINTPSIGYVGLIGLISNPGKVHDLTVDCNITAGSTIGAIAGYSLVTDNRTDVISNCTVHGTITGTDTVGAIIGGKDPGNDIVNCNSDAIVTGTIHVGGIIGAVTDGRCNITNCNFTGSVISTASSPQYIGGLIGYINTWDTVNNSIVSGCNVTGTITANNGSYIGGIVGATNSGLVELEHCNFTGIINNNSGTGSYIGGIVGNSNGNIITYCDATGTLNSSTSFQYVGGIAGSMNNGGNVENCKCIMNLTGSNDVGGIIGLNLGTPITNCNYQGNIVGSGYVGGIVGDNESGAISECKSSGSITASGNYVGGISGTGASGSYGNCQANMNISASGSNYVGGLTGNGGGAITNCSYNGNITANSRSGGLVGGDSANISQSYSLGSINGSGDYIGGVVGVCENSTISDTYSFMAVTALGNISGGFGGFVLNSTISRCYSAGAVANGTHVHGFGENEGGNTITDCFWDTQTSGQGSNAYDLSATGELTTAMQTELTYTGFDFTTPIWVINSSLNGGYPYLANTPLPPIPLNFYGNILNTSSIAGKVTEGSAVLLSVYGGILNTSNISGKVTELLETFTVYGNVSNISNLNPKLVRKSSLKTSISNLSDLTFLLGTVKMINLITDQNVVTGTDTYGTIEGFGANAGGQLSSSTDQAHSGSCSLKTIVHGNQNDGWYTDDLWVVSPSTEYTFDVWFNGPVNEVIGLVIQESSGSQPSENVTLTDAEWDHFQFTFTTDSNTNAVRLATSNPNWDNFTYYSDDISLYQGIPISGIQLETIEANIAFTPFLLSTITSLPILSPASLVLDDFTVRISCHTLLGVCEPLATLNNFNISSTKFRWNNLTDVSTIPDGCSVTYDIFTENIDQQQSQVNLSIPMALGQKASNQMIMQTFIPTQNNLTGFGILAMGIVGDFNSAGTVTANIYELTNGIPTTLLQSFVLPKTIDPNNPSVPYWGSQIKNGQQIGIELPLPFDLSGLNNAISYGLILSTDKIDSDNYYNLGISFGNYYKRGGFKYKLNNQWVNDGGADLWFNTYYPINIYTNKTSPVDLSAISLDSIKFRTHLNTNNLAETPVIDSITIKQEEYF